MSYFNRSVRAVIVDQYSDIHQVRQFPDSGLQSFFRIVSGQDDRDAFAVNHSSPQRSNLIIALVSFSNPGKVPGVLTRQRRWPFVVRLWPTTKDERPTTKNQFISI